MNMKTLSDLYYLNRELNMWASRSEQIRADIRQLENRGGLAGSPNTDSITLLTTSLQNIATYTANLKKEVQEAFTFIDSIPDEQTRDIISFRYKDGLSWTAVSVRLGGYISEDTLRVSAHRYLEKHIDSDSHLVENVV